ncbi:MAG: ATP-binding cassette domain-containing protein [Anaerolinea sp.]|nr:ATP-binding cassette domain-containing protein [Anaerolinea sp.]
MKDVSFEVQRGEVVGTPALASDASVIGRKGAGKSTLLKILSRITEPTGGQAKTCGGRVSTLLQWQLNSFSRSADRGKLSMHSQLASWQIYGNKH